MKRLTVIFIPFLFSCSVMVREASKEEHLRVSCPTIIRTEGFYCDGERAYSNAVQSGSRVKIENLLTGRSITIAVFRKEDVKGICVPDRFRGLLGPAPFPAKLEVRKGGHTYRIGQVSLGKVGYNIRSGPARGRAYKHCSYS